MTDPAEISRHVTPRDLRPTLRRLSTGLLAYGSLGLVLALAALLALVYINGRVAGLADRTTAQVGSVIATLDRTSTALTDAGASARSFSLTLERTPPTVRQAAQTLDNLRTNLRSVSGELGAFSVLGSNPLSGVAGLFGDMATDLQGLDTRLGLIADDLEDNRDRLLTNAASLEALGVRLGEVADELRAGVIEDSLADVQAIVMVLAFVLVLWTAMPAAGALLLGWWLRREFRLV